MNNVKAKRPGIYLERNNETDDRRTDGWDDSQREQHHVRMNDISLQTLYYCQLDVNSLIIQFSSPRLFFFIIFSLGLLFEYSFSLYARNNTLPVRSHMQSRSLIIFFPRWIISNLFLGDLEQKKKMVLRYSFFFL